MGQGSRARAHRLPPARRSETAGSPTSAAGSPVASSSVRSSRTGHGDTATRARPRRSPPTRRAARPTAGSYPGSPPDPVFRHDLGRREGLKPTSSSAALARRAGAQAARSRSWGAPRGGDGVEDVRVAGCAARAELRRMSSSAGRCSRSTSSPPDPGGVGGELEHRREVVGQLRPSCGRPAAR